MYEINSNTVIAGLGVAVVAAIAMTVSFRLPKTKQKEIELKKMLTANIGGKKTRKRA
jgi:hypothetical protein